MHTDQAAAFDPHDLPPLEVDADRVSRGSQIFSIIINVVLIRAMLVFALPVLAGEAVVALYQLIQSRRRR